jgi:hypothetical protein
MEIVCRLPVDIIRCHVIPFVPRKVDMESDVCPIHVSKPVEIVSRRCKKTVKEITRRYRVPEHMTRFYKPWIGTLDLPIPNNEYHIPMTFIEVRHLISTVKYGMQSITRESRTYRTVYCLYSKKHVFEWVRFMNRHFKKDRGIATEFKARMFIPTQMENPIHGKYTVWRYSRKQPWIYIPKAWWHSCPYELASTPFLIPMKNPYED